MAEERILGRPDLQLPATLESLIHERVWESLLGYGCALTGRSLNDGALFAAIGGAREFVVLGPPFQSLATLVEPRRPNADPLLARVMAAQRGWSNGEALAFAERVWQETYRTLGIGDVDEERAVLLATVDTHDWPSFLLDYRSEPPCVRRRRPAEGPGESATWVAFANTFDDFARSVGLDVNGPLYWRRQGPRVVAHESVPDDVHPLGGRLTLTDEGEYWSTMVASVRGQVIHQRRIRRFRRPQKGTSADVTGGMKRALYEILVAEDPEPLIRSFPERFPDDPEPQRRIPAKPNSDQTGPRSNGAEASP